MVTNKKIILICYGKANPYNMNGISRSVHNVAENLYYKKINFEVWGITPTPEIKTFKRKYNIFLFKKNNFNLISSDLKKKIKSLETKTIVHFFGAMSIEFFLISRLLKKKNIPWIVSPRGSLNEAILKKKKILKYIYIRLFEKKFLQEARYVHCLTISEKNELKKNFHNFKTVIIPNGFNYNELKKNNFFKHKVKIAKKNKFTIGYVGRLDINKGLDLFINGLKEFEKKNIEYVFYIVGEGPYKDNLKFLSKKYKLDKKIKFLGELRNFRKYIFLKKLDLFIHISRSEGVSNSIIEALALGKITLLSKETNMYQLFNKYKIKFILKDNKPETISSYLKKIINLNYNKRVMIENSSKLMIKKELNWKLLINKMIYKLYK